MKVRMFFAALVAVFATSVWAGQCPADIKMIDAAMLENKAQLNDRQLQDVMKLRDEGEALHAAGKHAESMAVLARAKNALGIKHKM